MLASQDMYIDYSGALCGIACRSSEQGQKAMRDGQDLSARLQQVQQQLVQAQMKCARLDEVEGAL